MRIITRRDTGLLTQWTFGSSPFDVDARAFINAAVITDLTTANAINKLVLAMKTNGTWDKCIAIYPFVGGSASSNRWNLKNTTLYTLTFSGGWTHSNNGVLPNGTNAYADTSLIPIDALFNNSMHVSNYSRTQNIAVSGVQLGSYDNTNEINMYQYFAAILFKGGSLYSYPTDAVRFNNTSTLGLQINNRSSVNIAKLHFNGSILNTNNLNRTSSLPNRSIYIGASNWTTGAAQFTPHQLAFVSIGQGFTDTQASSLYTDVQAFQTSLSRNV